MIFFKFGLWIVATQIVRPRGPFRVGSAVTRPLGVAAVEGLGVPGRVLVVFGFLFFVFGEGSVFQNLDKKKGCGG